MKDKLKNTSSNVMEDGCIYLRDRMIRDTIAARLMLIRSHCRGDSGMSTAS